MDLGKALTACRKARGFSRVALAKDSGLSVVALYNIERGASFPSQKTIEKICSTLGLPVGELLLHSIGEEDIPEEKWTAFRVLKGSIVNLLEQ